jgi:hypothetical protein
MHTPACLHTCTCGQVWECKPLHIQHKVFTALLLNPHPPSCSSESLSLAPALALALALSLARVRSLALALSFFSLFLALPPSRAHTHAHTLTLSNSHTPTPPHPHALFTLSCIHTRPLASAHPTSPSLSLLRCLALARPITKNTHLYHHLPSSSLSLEHTIASNNTPTHTRAQDAEYLKSIMTHEDLEDVLLNTAEDDDFGETLTFKHQHQVLVRSRVRALPRALCRLPTLRLSLSLSLSLSLRLSAPVHLQGQ